MDSPEETQEHRERDARNQQAALWLLMAMLPCLAVTCFAVMLFRDVPDFLTRYLPSLSFDYWLPGLLIFSVVWLVWCAWHLCRGPANARKKTDWWDVVGCIIFLSIVNATLSVVFTALSLWLMALAVR